MKNFIENLEDKIKKNIQLSKIEILDNTHDHVKHINILKKTIHLTINNYIRRA